MLFFYGSEEKKFNITDLVYEKCLKENFSLLSQYDISMLLKQPEIFLKMIDCDVPGIQLEVAVHEATHLSKQHSSWPFI